MNKSDRNTIYIETMLQLVEMELWNIDDVGMKRFKIIMKLYLDKGMEFQGNINLDSVRKKIIYKFYDNKQKKSIAYVSQKEYMKEYLKNN